MLRIPQSYIDELLEGDWALHDVTTEGMGLKGEYVVTAWPKETGIVAGIEIAERVFKTVGLRTEMLYGDGDHAFMHSPILRAWGTPEQLHATYKVAQCVMEYSTGISDSILVFDQHRTLTRNPVHAVRRLMAMEPERKVCVEVDTPEDGMFWADKGVHIIQCERFTPEVLAAFVREVKAKHPHVVVNAAGGINGDNVGDYADTRCDVLVTSWPYFGRPADIKMSFSPANPKP